LVAQSVSFFNIDGNCIHSIVVIVYLYDALNVKFLRCHAK